MKTGNEAPLLPPARLMARRTVKIGAATLVLTLVGYSAVVAKEARSAPALANISSLLDESAPVAPASAAGARPTNERVAVSASPEAIEVPGGAMTIKPLTTIDRLAADPNVRWFNGRPVKPVRVITMTVTAYSPDARSCGDSADGITATLHSVETNGFKLVAADPTLLPYGSMITVPGYDNDRVVPVLDCGGAIKGNRLDVLFPTHEAARKWGVRKIEVTVWGYVDGKPNDDPRKLR